MPARTHTATTATTTVTKAPSKRFELPTLDFKFTSLTEGTDIPPPLPSPVEEKIPELKVPEGGKTKNGTGADGTRAKHNGAAGPSPSSPSHSMVRSLKRAADDMPPSPTLSRPGSIRRLFSRNLLNAAYASAEADAEHATSHAAAASSILRPDSRSTGSIMDERKARRSSGWFRRLRGGTGSAAGSVGSDTPASKRMSMLFEEEKKAAGPPPPMIPELGELKSKVDLDEGSLGNDLFKSIK